MIKFSENDLFLVTGASSGIGKSITLALVQLGASVIAVARTIEKLELLTELTESKRIYCETKDLSDNVESLSEWVKDLSQKYGKLSGVIHAAGIQQTIPLRNMSISKTKELFDINFFSGISISKGFTMKSVRNGENSSIVFISSIAALKGNAGLTGYSASKGAINSAIRSLAIELSRYNIRVNAVAPGFVKTEMLYEWQQVDGEIIDKINASYPLGIGDPEDVANMVCFLVSNKAKWITGQTFVVDGGGSL